IILRSGCSARDIGDMSEIIPITQTQMIKTRYTIRRPPPTDFGLGQYRFSGIWYHFSAQSSRIIAKDAYPHPCSPHYRKSPLFQSRDPARATSPSHSPVDRQKTGLSPFAPPYRSRTPSERHASIVISNPDA